MTDRLKQFHKPQWLTYRIFDPRLDRSIWIMGQWFRPKKEFALGKEGTALAKFCWQGWGTVRWCQDTRSVKFSWRSSPVPWAILNYISENGRCCGRNRNKENCVPVKARRSFHQVLAIYELYLIPRNHPWCVRARRYRVLCRKSVSLDRWLFHWCNHVLGGWNRLSFSVGS